MEIKDKEKAKKDRKMDKEGEGEREKQKQKYIHSDKSVSFIGYCNIHHKMFFKKKERR